ncbi:MAG: hypothetical protein HN366_12595 [Deltaproteobacteria bacterium]|jgi:chromosome segregation ATPase|nr:hypothetical protein [Deltaproteobacteria bacterium]
MRETVIGRINDPRKKELIAYINKLGTFLSAKKKKAILEADLLKISREIIYIKLGIEETRKKIDLSRASIDKVSPKITGFRNRLASLEQEKKPLEDEYNRLLDIQLNIENKRADIENKKALIRGLTADIGKYAEEVEALKDQEMQTRDREQHIQDEIDSGKHKLNKLDEEIGVMTTTRDLLTGQIPDFIDIEEFPSLQGPEQNAEAYSADVKAAMEKMENDISAYQKGIAETHDLETSLTLEKEDREGSLEALEAQVQPDVDKESLRHEVAALLEQKEAFESEIAAHQDEIARLQPMVTEHGNRLEIERKSDLELDERVRNLTVRKQFISTLDDVEMEMENLKGQIAKSNVGLEANTGYLAVIKMVTNDVEAIDRRVTISLDVYNDALLELRRVVLLGHGILYGNRSE